MHLKKDIINYINNDKTLVNTFSNEILWLQTAKKSEIIDIVKDKYENLFDIDIYRYIINIYKEHISKKDNSELCLNCNKCINICPIWQLITIKYIIEKNELEEMNQEESENIYESEDAFSDEFSEEYEDTNYCSGCYLQECRCNVSYEYSKPLYTNVRGNYTGLF